MLNFIAAVFNEQEEVEDLVNHVEPYVDGLYFADDGSTDYTVTKLLNHPKIDKISVKRFVHTGLPETVKNEALKGVPDGSWVLMLDADERFSQWVLEYKIKPWLESEEAKATDYVYCRQIEIIDGNPVREFQKAKLFRKEAITFPLNNIHADDQFTGNGLYKEDWVVLHRKDSMKQRKREQEYLQTYDKLLEDGKIDEGRHQWLRGLHHFVK